MKLAAALLALMVGFAAWVFSARLSKEDFQSALLVLILMSWAAALTSFPLIPEIAKRRLLSDGELALGRVVHQETVQQGRSSWSAILYAFADGANRGFISRGTDYTDSLAEGAPLLVFYDALDPDKNTVPECSRFRLNASVTVS